MTASSPCRDVASIGGRGGNPGGVATGAGVVVRGPAAGAGAAGADRSNATPEVVLTLTAQGEGTWANRVGGVGMQVAVDSTASSNPNDLFNLVVSLFGTDPRTGASVLQSQET